MADEIKVDDTVQLKSGGPYMTVTSVDESGIMGGDAIHAHVAWFDKAHKPHSANYPLAMLELVPD